MNEAPIPYVVGRGKPPLASRFTPETARAARIGKRKAQPGIPPAQTGNEREYLSPLQREARVLFRDLQLMRAQMAKAVNAKEKSDLSAAYSRLLAAWQLFSQTPGPGVRKPGKDRLKPILDADPFAQIAPQQAAYTPVFGGSIIPL